MSSTNPPEKRRRSPSLSKYFNSKRVKSSASESAVLQSQPKSSVRPSKSELLIHKLPLYKWDEGFPYIKRLYIEDSRQLTVQLNRLLKGLGEEEIVALDLEWPYDKLTDTEGRVAVIQIASRSLVIVYGLSLDPESPLPKVLIGLLQNADVIKVGNNIAGDMVRLHRDYQKLPEFRSLLDLSKLAMHVDKAHWSWRRNPIIGLDELTRRYLNKELDKGDVRYSNWQARGDQMTEKQLDYASADVTVSLLLLDKLKAHGSLTREAMATLTFGKPASN